MAKNVRIGQPETDSIDGKKPKFFIPKVICLDYLADINFCCYSRQSLYFQSTTTLYIFTKSGRIPRESKRKRIIEYLPESTSEGSRLTDYSF